MYKFIYPSCDDDASIPSSTFRTVVTRYASNWFYVYYHFGQNNCISFSFQDDKTTMHLTLNRNHCNNYAVYKISNSFEANKSAYPYLTENITELLQEEHISLTTLRHLFWCAYRTIDEDIKHNMHINEAITQLYYSKQQIKPTECILNELVIPSVLIQIMLEYVYFEHT